MAAYMLESEVARGILGGTGDLAGVVDAAHVGEVGAGIVDGGEHVVGVDGAGRGQREAGQQDPEAAQAASAMGVGMAMHVEAPVRAGRRGRGRRSEEHTSELQSLMRISYAVFCLKKKKNEI